MTLPFPCSWTLKKCNGGHQSFLKGLGEEKFGFLKCMLQSMLRIKESRWWLVRKMRTRNTNDGCRCSDGRKGLSKHETKGCYWTSSLWGKYWPWLNSVVMDDDEELKRNPSMATFIDHCHVISVKKSNFTSKGQNDVVLTSLVMPHQKFSLLGLTRMTERRVRVTFEI